MFFDGNLPLPIVIRELPLYLGIERDIIKNVYLSSCKVSDILFPILIQFEFSPQIFEKNAQISNFIKIRAVGAEFLTIWRRNYFF